MWMSRDVFAELGCLRTENILDEDGEGIKQPESLRSLPKSEGPRGPFFFMNVEGGFHGCQEYQVSCLQCLQNCLCCWVVPKTQAP